MAKVCCSIVAGVRRKQTFLGVVDLWDAGAERTSARNRLDLVTGSGTCPVLSPIQKDGPALIFTQFPRRFSSRAPRMTVKYTCAAVGLYLSLNDMALRGSLTQKRCHAHLDAHGHAFSSCFSAIGSGATASSRSCVLFLQEEAVHGSLNAAQDQLLSSRSPPSAPASPRDDLKALFKSLWIGILARPCLKPSSATFASAKYPAGGGRSTFQGRLIAARSGLVFLLHRIQSWTLESWTQVWFRKLSIPSFSV